MVSRRLASEKWVWLHGVLVQQRRYAKYHERLCIVVIGIHDFECNVIIVMIRLFGQVGRLDLLSKFLLHLRTPLASRLPPLICIPLMPLPLLSMPPVYVAMILL